MINSRAKGKRGELAFSAELQRRGYYTARRGQQNRGGADSPDVVGLPGVHVEVKFTNRFNVRAAMKQAAKDAGDKAMPIVAHKSNRHPWIVVLNLENFLKLYDASGKEFE